MSTKKNQANQELIKKIEALTIELNDSITIYGTRPKYYTLEKKMETLRKKAKSKLPVNIYKKFFRFYN